MRMVLENASEHWHITEAADGAEAVKKAREIKPDLVILDLVMPAMDGFAAAREITKSLPGTPILMHTMFSSPMVDFEALAIGVSKVIAKSEGNALVSAVMELIGPNPTAQSS